jgi:hypothetical protein
MPQDNRRPRFYEAAAMRVERRRDRIRTAVNRGRESRVPTWALFLVLVAIIGVWVAFVLLASGPPRG